VFSIVFLIRSSPDIIVLPLCTVLVLFSLLLLDIKWTVIHNQHSPYLYVSTWTTKSLSFHAVGQFLSWEPWVRWGPENKFHKFQVPNLAELL